MKWKHTCVKHQDSGWHKVELNICWSLLLLLALFLGNMASTIILGMEQKLTPCQLLLLFDDAHFFPRHPLHFPGYKSASHPFRQLPLERESTLCNPAEKMAIPHPRWVFTALSLPWLALKYLIAFMLLRLKPAGLVFRRPPTPRSVAELVFQKTDEL